MLPVRMGCTHVNAIRKQYGTLWEFRVFDRRNSEITTVSDMVEMIFLKWYNTYVGEKKTIFQPILERRKNDETYHSGLSADCTLMSADEFSARFTEKLMEVQTLLGDDQYLSMISESDNVLCMYLCQRAMEK